MFDGMFSMSDVASINDHHAGFDGGTILCLGFGLLFITGTRAKMLHDPEYIQSKTFIPTLVEVRGELSHGDVGDKIGVLENLLPQYERGDPEEPGSGFQRFRVIPSEGSERDHRTRIPIYQDPIGSFRHRSENYKEELVYLDGEFEEGHVAEFGLVDVFWIGPIMIFQGDRGSANSVIRRLQREVMNEIKIERVPLDPEVFYAFEETSPGTDLRPRESISVSAEGISTEIEQARISGDIHDTEFTERGKITHVFKKFEYLDCEILSHITEDRITVQSISPIETDQEINQKDILLISIKFINDLLDINQARSKKKGIR